VGRGSLYLLSCPIHCGCLNRQEDPDYVVPNKFKWITELEADDIEYLRELPYTISIPSKKALIVHAGIVPGVPLDEQKLTNFITMRNLDIEDGNYVACELTFRGDAWIKAVDKFFSLLPE
jgi:hypothetical protein